jgi:peptidoglycan/xylan/chitin deacetylase (PgdA/CDA1 family)
MRFFSSPRLVQLLFPKWTWRGPENNVIYLTFDDGPTPESTPWILSFLKKNDVKATFFCVGEQAIKSPYLIKQIVEEGHSIGNHTMHHENGWKTKTGKYLDSITQSAAPIDSHLFRPPYGKIRLSQSKKLRELGYKIIMWTWLSYDFDKAISTDKIISKSKKIKGGDILVFHDNVKAQEKIKVVLPCLINAIRERGFIFKMLS